MATIYHNPRCSKSRQTLELIRDRNPDIVLYLKTPPSAETLAELAAKLGKSPLEMMRAKEKRFKELGLSILDERADQEWFAIMAQNPMLIERPIVVEGQRARIGRPPESVLDLF